MRICTKCGQAKPLTAFSSNGQGLYKKRCKPCRSADQSARYAAKSIEERRLEMERIKAWVKSNPERYRRYAKTTRDARPEHYRLKVQLRRRRHRLVTPSWASKEVISRIYSRAVEMTRTTGIPHEVDHIVPIVSDLVCGLHVEHNLRVISRFENRSKSNGTWPDMP